MTLTPKEKIFFQVRLKRVYCIVDDTQRSKRNPELHPKDDARKMLIELMEKVNCQVC